MLLRRQPGKRENKKGIKNKPEKLVSKNNYQLKRNTIKLISKMGFVSTSFITSDKTMW